MREEVTTVVGVANLIRQENIDEILERVANDREDERNIRDLFEMYSFEGIQTGYHVEPDVEVLYEGPEYLLVSSARYGRSGVERSKYRITLVIGHDPDQSTGFLYTVSEGIETN